MKRIIMIAICLIPLACNAVEWIEDPSVSERRKELLVELASWNDEVRHVQ